MQKLKNKHTKKQFEAIVNGYILNSVITKIISIKFIHTVNVIS